MGAARASIVVVPAIVAVERIAGCYWGQAIATNEEASLLSLLQAPHYDVSACYIHHSNSDHGIL